MNIQPINTNSVDEFLETLYPLGGLTKEFRNPIYRGQGNSDWDLAPSLYRKKCRFKDFREKKEYNRIDHLILYEIALLKSLIQNCDDIGIQIPLDSTELRYQLNRDDLDTDILTHYKEWPTKECLHFIAMAQHHGIPTRLLDWTTNPYTAAYFAASHVINKEDEEKKPENLAVWIIERDHGNHEKFYYHHDEFLFFHAAGSSSKNLTSQSGLFTLFSEKLNENSNESINIKDQNERHKALFEKYDRFKAHKIMLPAKLAGDLLYSCNKLGQSAASVYPSVDGAAQKVLEFRLSAIQEGSKFSKSAGSRIISVSRLSSQHDFSRTPAVTT